MMTCIMLDAQAHILAWCRCPHCASNRPAVGTVTSIACAAEAIDEMRLQYWRREHLFLSSTDLNSFICRQKPWVQHHLSHPSSYRLTNMASTDRLPVVGSCYCGKVQFRSTERPHGMTFCYCRTCRLLHGGPFAPWTNVSRQSLQWIGKDNLAEMRFSSCAMRTFCLGCHCPVTMTYDADPDDVGIVASIIDEANSSACIPKVEQHIFTKECPSWYKIAARGAQYEGMPERMVQQINQETNAATSDGS